MLLVLDEKAYLEEENRSGFGISIKRKQDKINTTRNIILLNMTIIITSASIGLNILKDFFFLNV